MREQPSSATDRLEERLAQERRTAGPEFRSNLAEMLVQVQRDAPPRPRPARLRLRMLGYALAGSLLLWFAVAGLFGIGPLA